MPGLNANWVFLAASFANGTSLGGKSIKYTNQRLSGFHELLSIDGGEVSPKA